MFMFSVVSYQTINPPYILYLGIPDFFASDALLSIILGELQRAMNLDYIIQKVLKRIKAND